MRPKWFGAIDSAALMDDVHWLASTPMDIRGRLTRDVVDQTADAVGRVPRGVVRVGATVWADDDDPIDLDPLAAAIDRAAQLRMPSTGLSQGSGVTDGTGDDVH